MRPLLARILLGLLSSLLFFMFAEVAWRVIRPADAVDRFSLARVERTERRASFLKESLEIARFRGGSVLVNFVSGLRDDVAGLVEDVRQDASDLSGDTFFAAQNDRFERAVRTAEAMEAVVQRIAGTEIRSDVGAGATPAELPDGLRADLEQLHGKLDSVSSVLREVLDAARPELADLHHTYRMYFETAEREEFQTKDGVERGYLVDVKPSPRQRWRFAPDSTFYICYDPATRPYLDDRGCVRVDLDERGCRERPELSAPKPEGQRRLVCIGDSFTFGWGVPVELAWPRLVENELRRTDDGVRTVNCGAAGAIFVDEYAMALEHRFSAYDPDAVLVTLCLNDLIITNAGVAHKNPDAAAQMLNRGGGAWWRASKLLATAADTVQAWRDWGYPDRAALSFPAGYDASAELLQSPPTDRTMLLHVVQGQPPELFWPSGNPQAALLRMRDWCKKRGVAFGVVIWPFIQGLGDDEHYPFPGIHEAVAAFCRTNTIEFLDVLPALKGHRTPELWVSPADYHGNELAQRLAVELLTPFAASLMTR